MMEVSDQTLYYFLFLSHPRAPTKLGPVRPKRPPRASCTLTGWAQPSSPTPITVVPSDTQVIWHSVWQSVLGRVKLSRELLLVMCAHVLCSVFQCRMWRSYPPSSSTSKLCRSQVLVEPTVKWWTQKLEMGGEPGT